MDIADRIKVVEDRLRLMYQASTFNSNTQRQINACLNDLELIRESYADEWEQLELYRRGLKMTTFEASPEWDKRIICKNCSKKWSEHITNNEVVNECPK